MHLLLGGVRGGSPIADTAYSRFGGDTTSLLVTGVCGSHVVVDGGTGLRVVSNRLSSERENRSLLMLFTHFHHDHINGLPGFKQMYDPLWQLEFSSRSLGGHTIRGVFDMLVAPPVWPLSINDLPASTTFSVLDDQRMNSPKKFGGLHIRWCPVHHPGGSTAFRIDEPSSGSSVVIATDIEWAESTGGEKRMLESLCRTPSEPDILVFDGKYSRENYESCRGWGHSTWEEGVEIARSSGARRLLITHHSSEYDDDKLDRMDERVRKTWRNAGLARQGEIIDL